MVMAGLLWYDDDARRPLAAKIIEATERYRDRIGFAPTVCQLPPQQLKALTEKSASNRKRGHTPVIELPRKLRLEPDDRLHPNTFLLGMGEDDIAIPNPLLAGGDETPQRSRRTKQPRPARTTPKAVASASPPPSPAIMPKVARVAKTAAHERAAEPKISARPVKSTVKQSARATQAQGIVAKQATLWDTAPATTKRVRSTAKPAMPTVENVEKGARIAKPVRATAGKLAKPAKAIIGTKATKETSATKVATPTRSAATRAAKGTTKPAAISTKSAIPPNIKAARLARDVNAGQRTKPTLARITKATERATERPAQYAKPGANKTTQTTKSVAKKAAHATITPASPVKPKATRTPTVKKAAADVTSTHASSKPATPRRRLARSA